MSNAFISSFPSHSPSFCSSYRKSTKTANIQMNLMKDSNFHENYKDIVFIMMASAFFMGGSLVTPNSVMAAETIQLQEDQYVSQTIVTLDDHQMNVISTRGSEALTNILLSDDEPTSNSEAITEVETIVEEKSQEEIDKENTRQQALDAILAATTARKSNNDGAIVTNLEADLKSLNLEIDQQTQSSSSGTNDNLIALKKLTDQKVKLEKQIASERNLQEIRNQRLIDEAPRRQRQKEMEIAKQANLDRLDKLQQTQDREFREKQARKKEELQKLIQQQQQNFKL